MGCEIPLVPSAGNYVKALIQLKKWAAALPFIQPSTGSNPAGALTPAGRSCAATSPAALADEMRDFFQIRASHPKTVLPSSAKILLPHRDVMGGPLPFAHQNGPGPRQPSCRCLGRVG
jgi:hypothetical protein